MNSRQWTDVSGKELSVPFSGTHTVHAEQSLTYDGSSSMQHMHGHVTDERWKQAFLVLASQLIAFARQHELKLSVSLNKN